MKYPLRPEHACLYAKHTFQGVFHIRKKSLDKLHLKILWIIFVRKMKGLHLVNAFNAYIFRLNMYKMHLKLVHITRTG